LLSIGNLYEKEQRQLRALSAEKSKFCATSEAAKAAKSRSAIEVPMSASTTIRTAALQGVAISRGPARGLLVAGGQVHTNTESLASRVEKVVRVAAAHATAVDRESRLPQEAITALRDARLLGVAVPREFGGEGASVADVADICYALGRACSSTAMIYAMHQTKVACISRHGRGSAWHQLLMRRICGEQMLLASSTT
jgi:hypothetical protein